jgi:hypothetical protein
MMHGRLVQGVEALCVLKDALYAAIPAPQRQSRGITWVVQRIAGLLAAECSSPEQIRDLAATLYAHLPDGDLALGVPIFLMADYGRTHPTAVFDFFAQVADAEDWVVREFAAGSFRVLIRPGWEVVSPWLAETAQCDHPKLRRFVSETLRPVTANRWLNAHPDESLAILRRLFREPHPYPRTSVGNNLSDLARRNPELILSIVKELVESGDGNSYWIAYRACRNLVKRDPERIMALLRTDSYHYKDRNFYRKERDEAER